MGEVEGQREGRDWGCGREGEKRRLTQAYLGKGMGGGEEGGRDLGILFFFPFPPPSFFGGEGGGVVFVSSKSIPLHLFREHGQRGI